MREAAADVKPYQPLDIRDYEHQASLESHRVFGHIRFRRYASRPYSLLQDAHLESGPKRFTPPPLVYNDSLMGRYTVTAQQPPDDYPGQYLSDHPLVVRSFATSIPVTSMLLLDLCGHPLMERLLAKPDAITVMDVLGAMHREYVSSR